MLTDREREGLALVGAGLSNQEIAEHLVVSQHTAKTHVKRAMVKLDAHDRAQLVVIADETGARIGDDGPNIAGMSHCVPAVDVVGHTRRGVAALYRQARP